MSQKNLLKAVSASNNLREIRDPDVLIEKILYEARGFTNADAGTIYVVKENMLLPYYAQNKSLSREEYNNIDIERLSVPINKESISGYCALTKEPLIISDVYNIPKKLPYLFRSWIDETIEYRSKSMIVIPLKDNQQIYGVIQLINKKSPRGRVIPFKEEDAFLLSLFALNATIAIEQAQVTKTLIAKLVDIVEMHDPNETAPHVQRVAEYSSAIYTRWANLRNRPQKKLERERANIKHAAMLHDLGKISIPNNILHSYSSLDPEQLQLLKTHTWKGSKLFQYAETELELTVRDVTLTHHERWDGTGYPGYVDINDGKSLYPNHPVPIPRKEKEIPLSGRIVALADAYDAMRTKRSYKEALREEICLQEIKMQSGKQFDPELVSIFFQIKAEIRKINKKYELDIP